MKTKECLKVFKYVLSLARILHEIYCAYVVNSILMVLEVLSKRFIDNLFIINKDWISKDKKIFQNSRNLLLRSFWNLCVCLYICIDIVLLGVKIVFFIGTIFELVNKNSPEKVRQLYTVRKVGMIIDEYILVMHIH